MRTRRNPAACPAAGLLVIASPGNSHREGAQAALPESGLEVTHLYARLAMLSACEAGLGSITSGEGLTGMSW